MQKNNFLWQQETKKKCKTLKKYKKSWHKLKAKTKQWEVRETAQNGQQAVSKDINNCSGVFDLFYCRYLLSMPKVHHCHHHHHHHHGAIHLFFAKWPILIYGLIGMALWHTTLPSAHLFALFHKSQ